MPEIPPAAIMAAATAIERELLSGRDYSMAQDSDEALARVALEAAAPILTKAWGVKKLRKRVAELEPFEPRTRGLRVAENGTPVVDVHFPESFAQMMLANFRWYLDEHEAPNYVQMPMTDMTTGETYECTIGRPGGKSPHEMRMLAEARVAQLEAELARTREVE